MLRKSPHKVPSVTKWIILAKILMLLKILAALDFAKLQQLKVNCFISENMHIISSGE